MSDIIRDKVLLEAALIAESWNGVNAEIFAQATGMSDHDLSIARQTAVGIGAAIRAQLANPIHTEAVTSWEAAGRSRGENSGD